MQRPSLGQQLVDVEADRSPLQIPILEPPVARDFREQVELATLIVAGRTGNRPPEALEEGTIVSDRILSVRQVYKGNQAESEVRVVIFPHNTGTLINPMVDDALLEWGQEYVLFLWKIPATELYTIIRGPEPVHRIDLTLRTSSGEKLSDLEHRISLFLGSEASASTRSEHNRPETDIPAAASLLFGPGPRSSQDDVDDHKISAESDSEGPTYPAGTVVVLDEGFEGAFPGAWDVFDNNGTANGEVYWDDTSYRSYVGNWSGGSADGGANASPPGASYSNDMDSWMVYGPFSLADAAEAFFSFRFWNESELNFDYFKYLVSVNGSNFYGYQYSGNSGGWLSRSMDLTNVPTLGDVTGDSSVWVAFVFSSDSTVNAYEGAYVDSVRVEKTIGSSPADLALQLIGVTTGGTYAPGDSITIQNVTENIGGETSASYRLTFYASTNTTCTSGDYQIGYVDRSGLVAGGMHSFNTSGNLPAGLPDGSYYVCGILEIADASSANNTNYDPAPIVVSTPSSPADLALQFVGVTTGSTYAPGDSITIQNVTENIGGETSASYRLTFYASTNTTCTSGDYQIGYVDRSGLAAGGTHSFNTSGNLPAELPNGNYYVCGILGIADANSANNTNYDPAPIVVSTPPSQADLALQLIGVTTGGTYAPGDPITIQNVTENIGGETSASYRLTFYASTNTTCTSGDYQIGYVDRSGLVAGGMHSFNTSGNLPAGLPDGSFYVCGILEIADANSANNTNYDSAPIVVSTPSAPADLALQFVGVTTGSTYSPGDPITIQNVTENIGGETSASYRLTFYASTNTTCTSGDYQIGYVDRSGLAAGGTHSFNTSGNLPAGLPDGSYYVCGILEIADANSANNTNYDPMSITVETPIGADIRIEPLALSFSNPQQVTRVGAARADETPRQASRVVVDMSSVDLASVINSLSPEGQLRIEGVPLDGEAAPAALEMWPIDVFASDALIVIHGPQGEEYMPPPRNTYLNGLVDGDPHSYAFVSVRSSGAARGLIASRGRYWILGGGDAAAGPEIGLALREVDAETEFAAFASAFQCGTDRLASNLDEMALSSQRQLGLPSSSVGGATYSARVAIETDWEFFQLFGNASDAADYIGDLIGFSSGLYSSEVDTALVVGHVSLWSTASDPWEESTTLCGLYEFGRYWNDNHTDITRTVAHFLSGKNNDGGIAWVGVLCSGPFSVDHDGDCPNLMPQSDDYGGGYGYSGGLNNDFDINNPEAVWDIVVVSHEVGHNFNSPHTHCYAGIGGNTNPVDECWAGQCGSTGCYCGAMSLPCETQGAGCGTIMSYCHQLAGGLGNISLTFGTGHPFGVDPDRVPNRMTSHVLEAAGTNPGCLVAGGGDDQFTIYNDGDSTLNVTSMNLDAGATWISWSPSAPFDITPGASEVVTVSVDFDLAPQGVHTRRLLVESNDLDESPYPNGVFITADNPVPFQTVSIAPLDSVAGEPSDDGSYRVTRSASSGSLTVNIGMSGTATNGVDYSAIGPSVVFSSGSSTFDVTLEVLDDSLVEGSETATASVQPGSGYNVGTPSSGTITITDDDNPQFDTQLMNGEQVDDLLSSSTPQGAWKYYYADLGAGSEELLVDLFDMSGDLDLYVRYGVKPDLISYDCRPLTIGIVAEQCLFASPTEGRWWVGVNNHDIGSLTYSVRALWSTSSLIFEDGFESGDTSLWSSTVP